MAFDIEGAKKAGYSDAEIADYLGAQNKFDVKGARGAGYSDAEIINHFSGKNETGAVSQEPESYDPTSGMSAGQKFAAAYGGVVPRLATGIKQNAIEVANIARKLPPELGAIPGVGGALDLLKTGADAAGITDETVAQQRADVDETKRLNAPLLNTRAGKVGNIAGGIATALPTAFVPGANTYAGSGLLGGLYGLAEPVGTEDSRLMNAGLGAAAGIASQAIGRGLGAAYQSAKAYLAPMTEKGQQKIVAETLKRFAQDPDALANAASYQSPINGVQPSLAEATLDPGIATLQLATKNADPIAKAQLVQQEINNNAARLSAISQVAKTPEERMAAVLARKQATTPLYQQVALSEADANPTRVINLIDRMTEANPANKALVKPLSEIRESLFENYPVEQRGADAWRHLNDAINEKALPQQEWNALAAARTIMNRVKRGDLEADEALQQLKNIKGARAATNEAIDIAREQMRTPDYVLMQKPQQLKSAMDNIKALLGNEDNAFVKRELMTIKNALGHQISKVEPAFGQAEKTFAEMSQPINQMDIGQTLYEKLVPALTDTTGVPTRVTASQYANALRNAEQTVQKATGMKLPIEKIMTPEQLQTLQGVASDLGRKAVADDMARTLGSTTAQNLAAQNLMRQTLGPLGVPSGWMEGEVLPNIAQALMAPYKLTGADKAINQRLVQALTNPQQAADLVQRLAPADQGKLIEFLSRAALPAGIESRNAMQQ